MDTYDYVGAIIAFEDNTLDEDEIVALFSYLITRGILASLQGSYQRCAYDLISQGLLYPDGTIPGQEPDPQALPEVA